MSELKPAPRHGALPGNKNAVRSGFHTQKLPAGCEDIEAATCVLGEQLEAEILARHGEIDVYRAALIRNCVLHERRLQLVQRWLRIKGPKLEISDRTQLLRDAGSAAKDLTKTMQELGLDQKAQGKIWEHLKYDDAEPQGDVDESAGVSREPAD